MIHTRMIFRNRHLPESLVPLNLIVNSFYEHDSIEPQLPIMKGQYEITNNLCSWIGIVRYSNHFYV